MQLKDLIRRRRSANICCHYAADQATVAEKLQLVVVTSQTFTTVNNNKFKKTITSELIEIEMLHGILVPESIITFDNNFFIRNILNTNPEFFIIGMRIKNCQRIIYLN